MTSATRDVITGPAVEGVGVCRSAPGDGRCRCRPGRAGIRAEAIELAAVDAGAATVVVFAPAKSAPDGDAIGGAPVEDDGQIAFRGPVAGWFEVERAVAAGAADHGVGDSVGDGLMRSDIDFFFCNRIPTETPRPCPDGGGEMPTTLRRHENAWEMFAGGQRWCTVAGNGWKRWERRRHSHTLVRIWKRCELRKRPGGARNSHERPEIPSRENAVTILQFRQLFPPL